MEIVVFSCTLSIHVYTYVHMYVYIGVLMHLRIRQKYASSRILKEHAQATYVHTAHI